ncbi:CinA family protein [Salinibaculum rarum]|uniref:CinA family protein n=1 Tax=Salinibaculum rarum TaxID=3058903 RepID=UPI00265FCB1C|nr:CinA family protein [Salinibaculum sp. KK48]
MNTTARPVEERVADTLRDADATVAVAEAATGGLVATLLTTPPGASDYFDRAYVTYAYDALREELAVSRETLDEHGAVSAPTVREMAQAARDRARTDFGVATAAVAGPGGGTDERPVGTVFVAVASAAPWESGDSTTTVERYTVDGDRDGVREQAARQALRDLAAAVQDGEQQGL